MQLAKTDLIILDDLCMAPLIDEQQRDLLEILDDRFNVRSTLVTSQLPIQDWHQHLGDPTLADAIPQGIPEVRPVLAIPLGLLALVTVAREPPQPTSQVDSRRKTFLKPGRLHAARIAIA